MKRFFLSILVSLTVLLGFVNVVDSQPAIAVSAVEPAEQAVDVMAELKSKFLPQIQSILTPEQENQLETAIVDGKASLRKAFKSLTLTPDQKNQLATVFKSLPKREVFTSMTPAQKREFFMQKKEIFKPTPEEIAGYKVVKDQ